MAESYSRVQITWSRFLEAPKQRLNETTLDNTRPARGRLTTGDTGCPQAFEQGVRPCQ